MKGLNFNVTLSDEQMEHIASLSADKINYTMSRLKATDMWYEDEIKRLTGQLAKRNELLVNKELFIERLRQIIDDQQKEIELLKRA